MNHITSGFEASDRCKKQLAEGRHFFKIIQPGASISWGGNEAEIFIIAILEETNFLAILGGKKSF